MSKFEKFCKLFETETHGQILCVVAESQDDDSGKPAIIFQCQPAGLGICHTKMTYPENVDTDEAWDKAKALLEELTEDDAKAAVQPIFDATAGVGDDDE